MKPRLSLFPFILALATVWSAAPLLGQPKPTELVIDGDTVYFVLQPDGIPSIDEPEFVPAAKAKFMSKREMVIGVTHNGISKAYSAWHLDKHEIVNDVFGDDPLAVTW